MRTVVIFIVVSLGLAAACTKPNPNTCCVTEAQCAALGADALRPCEAGQACSAEFTCVAAECATSVDCTSTDAPICIDQLCVSTCIEDAQCADVTGRPYCSEAGACVGCEDPSQCPASAAICDAQDHTCRGCEADDECASGVCVEADGVCAAESRVIYAVTNGVDGECTRSAPCGTFAHALSKVRVARDVIHIAGGAFDLGTQVSTIGMTVIVDGSNTNLLHVGPAFAVRVGGDLTLERIRMSCPDASTLDVANLALLRLHRAELAAAGSGAIHASGATLSIVDSSVSNTGSIGGPGSAVVCELGGQLLLSRSAVRDTGVSASNCGLSVTRSQFSNSTEQSLGINGGTAIVENSLFVQTDQFADAVTMTAGQGSSFRFNTIVNTSTVTDQGVALYCSANLEITSNIFAYNSTNPINGAACVVRNSLFDMPGMADAGTNTVGDVAAFFVDRMQDFHLAPGSPALAGGEPGLVTIDLDGTARGASPDIGAFEAP